VLQLYNSDQKYVVYVTARWANLDPASRPSRLHDGEPEPGQQRPPGADVQPRHPHHEVRQQGPERERHDGALGRAHHRVLAVPELPGPHLQRHQHRPVVRHAAAGKLPGGAGIRRQHPGAARRADAAPLRQRVLPEPAGQAWPTALGPGALQRRVAGRAGAAVQRQPGTLRLRLRRRHDKDGERQPAHWKRRPDQGQLQGG
jgi:hypothetical protein